jgi:hypothetical protein
MKPCLWYHSADKNPDKSGYYLAYKSYSIAENETDIGFYYYNKVQGHWQDSNYNQAHFANVYYWTEANPEKWVENDPPVSFRKKTNKKSAQPNSAMEKAWADVLAAVERYELIKVLSRDVHN